MKVQLDHYPDSGIEIESLNNGFYHVRLFKNKSESTAQDGTTIIAADVVALTIRIVGDVQKEITDNFDYYWMKAESAEVEKIRDKGITKLQKLLDNTDYEAVKHSEGIITDAQYANLKVAREAWRTAINTLETATTLAAVDAVMYSTDIPSVH